MLKYVNVMAVKLMAVREVVKQLKINKIQRSKILIENLKSAIYRHNGRKW